MATFEPKSITGLQGINSIMPQPNENMLASVGPSEPAIEQPQDIWTTLQQIIMDQELENFKKNSNTQNFLRRE